MLTVSQLSKSFSTQPLFSEVSFTLNTGERLGLVGPNGCGKTTLLRILAREEKPDRGGFHYEPPDLTIGYLPQGFTPREDERIDQFINRIEGDLDGLSQQLEELASVIAQNPRDAALNAEYDAVLTRLSLASENAGAGAEVLSGLGLSALPGDLPVARLSGGQKTRLGLAAVLLARPHLLLLDEPTNHLDLEMLAWLENWLSGYPYAALVVSHDRTFLDHTATSILELNPQTQRTRLYAGNYTAYLEQKQAETDRQWQQYTDQLEEIDRLKSAAAHLRGIAKFKKGGKADTADKFAKGFFGNRSQGTVGRAKNIEQRLERLLTEERVEKPRAGWQMKIDFGESPAAAGFSSGRDVLVFEDLSIGYGSQPLISGINLVLRFGRRVALVGPNGCGKTTLLRTVIGQVPPLSGLVRTGSRVRLGYMAQEQENLSPDLNALQSLQQVTQLNETEARSFLSKYLFKGDDVFTPTGMMSYGERSRLSLALLVAEGANLLLLDEPVNHLDIPARTRFEQALAGFEGTILAVIHDRYFIQGFANEIWEVNGTGIRSITGLDEPSA